MCNGSGSVRVEYRERIVYVDRVSEREKDEKKSEKNEKKNSKEKIVKEIVEKEIFPAAFYETKTIPYTVSARVNKNEFRHFANSISCYLEVGENQRAAASYNYLMHLLSSAHQKPEEDIIEDLKTIKKNHLDDAILGMQGEYLPASKKKIEQVKEVFQKIYTKYYAGPDEILEEKITNGNDRFRMLEIDEREKTNKTTYSEISDRFRMLELD